MADGGKSVFLQSLARQQESEQEYSRQKASLRFSKSGTIDAAVEFVKNFSAPVEKIKADDSHELFDAAFYDEVAETERNRLARLDPEEVSRLSDVKSSKPHETIAEVNEIDKEYFGEYVLRASEPAAESLNSSAVPANSEPHSTHSDVMQCGRSSHNLGYIDSQYFDGSDAEQITTVSNPIKSASIVRDTPIGQASVMVSKIQSEDLNYFDQQLIGEDVNSLHSGSEKSQNIDANTGHNYNKRQTSLEKRSMTANTSVYDADSRSLSKSPSRGVTVFNKLIQDLDKEPGYCVVDLLMESLVYEDERIVCLNKPYSLFSQGGPGVHHSISKYLPEIAKRLKYEGTLYLCHRLDRDVSGTVLLAKGEDESVNIKRRFEQGQIHKMYNAITRGVPKPMEGVIDIAIATDTLINGNYRSVLVPPTIKSKRRNVSTAETEYKVMKHNSNASLVELRPLTGRKHQLRVHLAQGLETPILGDHKYTHRDRHAPQSLSRDLAAKFHLERDEMKYMPMHLHAKELVLPKYFENGRQLELNARLPLYFIRTIKIMKFFRK